MNNFRLSTDSMFQRQEELTPIDPKKIVFLSVEGNVTENNYFEWIEKYRDQLGITSQVHVYPLYRSKNDTNSSPTAVLDLLDEYIEIREDETLPNSLKNAITDIISKYSEKFINDYLSKKLDLDTDTDKIKELENDLFNAGIDYSYYKFLKNCKGNNENCKGNNDVFGIVIDRDWCTHTTCQLTDLVEKCREKNYHLFLTTPCFEFWLLLHIVDIKKDFFSDLDNFLNNLKISNRHTFTSKKVSELAHHSKKIPEDAFKTNYLTKIDYAIEQVHKSFSQNVIDLIGTNSEEKKYGELGSNLPELFEILRS